MDTERGKDIWGRTTVWFTTTVDTEGYCYYYCVMWCDCGAFDATNDNKITTPRTVNTGSKRGRNAHIHASAPPPP